MISMVFHWKSRCARVLYIYPLFLRTPVLLLIHSVSVITTLIRYSYVGLDLERKDVLSEASHITKIFTRGIGIIAVILGESAQL